LNTPARGLRRNIRRVFTGLLITLVSTSTLSAEITIAVAANFKATIDKLIPLYEQATGDIVYTSVGSSGKLATQIIHGAPYDIFLSADATRPAMLITQHQALAKSLFSYATGTLALWQPDGQLPADQSQVFDIAPTGIIGLANPRHAPYGIAAQQVLMAMGQWKNLSNQRRLAFAESVSQAWQYAASGNVKAAFIPLSHIIHTQGHDQIDGTTPSTVDGTYWLPPEQWYSPIIQQGVILSRSNNQVAARRFCDWLQSDVAALRVIVNSGYHTTSQQPIN
jgi:molybdate transport system substrate-binding protein